MQLLRVLGYS